MGAERPPFSPVISLLTVSSIWDGRLGAALKTVGLTTRKYALLAHIGAEPGISFSELARRSQITVQTAHTAVRALAADDMVTDATAHAGAASDLRVTAKGQRALAAAEALLASLDAELTAELPSLTGALQGLHENPFSGQTASFS
ncbi:MULTISPECIES: MarR family winged helix-turn-helix transcriptional regulator [unclassified Microbacterium]|uniref:MarR family winged helix-turn-helix transcriptional regulator n=1 Tax=unclassified Microbacterium TaxID=2609290 RepID=UPI00214C8232|nr:MULTISPECIES: helix-turn-helix domain-containing protein [unclassified Microbacterium]MCR2799282.1 MarR family winged helix-turn-helix transcriptional regulator [Microbacterium sp. zg.Y818]MCR2824142.1 MarR family winged helix-turn-helix transcriptional regulator [Microbacterium sp. zg.Y909]WIM21285.1 helix-turn-helix domain-containing protein [Microbacterium sp. zg-Y818]